MKLPAVIVAVALLTLSGTGQTQERLPAPLPSLPDSALIPPTPVPAVPPERTVEQMLDTLETLRVKQAELEQQVRAVVEAIGKKVEKQTERMRKLGIGKDQPGLKSVISPPPAIPMLIGSP